TMLGTGQSSARARNAVRAMTAHGDDLSGCEPGTKPTRCAAGNSPRNDGPRALPRRDGSVRNLCDTNAERTSAEHPREALNPCGRNNGHVVETFGLGDPRGFGAERGLT